VAWSCRLGTKVEQIGAIANRVARQLFYAIQKIVC
jgi:hypothetical protein